MHTDEEIISHSGQAGLAAVWPRIKTLRSWAVTQWWWGALAVPFVITRLVWLLAAAFARGSLQPNPTYLSYFQQGGQLTRIFWLDIFAHWDAKFYLSIAQQGYSTSSDLSQYSNVAFYPLYPALAKSFGWLGLRLPDGAVLAVGLLVSNVCFLAACVLFYRLAVGRMGFSPKAAGRALALLIVFPASFYFSSFYPESLFLLLSLLAFSAAYEGRWGLAGLAGALVTLTRIQGVLVVAALAWIYLDARGWKLARIRADVLWLGLAPLGLAVHFYQLYRLTGHLLAPFEVQAAWGRGEYGFLQGLRLQLESPGLDVFKIDALLLVGFLICGAWMLRRPATRALGVYTLLMCALPVSTGLLVSVSRFLAVVFPVFLLLGQQMERRKGSYDLLRAAFFTLQVLYFAAWVNFYWVA